MQRTHLEQIAEGGLVDAYQGAARSACLAVAEGVGGGCSPVGRAMNRASVGVGVQAGLAALSQFPAQKSAKRTPVARCKEKQTQQRHTITQQRGMNRHAQQHLTHDGILSMKSARIVIITRHCTTHNKHQVHV
jgi:hypothetical protein